MMHGFDTGFLVAAEVMEHADHAVARATIARLISAGDVGPLVEAELARKRGD